MPALPDAYHYLFKEDIPVISATSIIASVAEGAALFRPTRFNYLTNSK